MSEFKEGTRVLAIENSKMKRGVISSLYDVLGVAVVQFDDDSVGKVKVSDLVIDQEATKEEPEKPTEPVEKSEITITPDEFKKIASKVVMKNVKKMGEGGGLLVLTFTIFVAELHGALFFDAVDND